MIFGDKRFLQHGRTNRSPPAKRKLSGVVSEQISTLSLMTIEQGYRSRVDINGARRIKAEERQEGLQAQNGEGGAMESIFPAVDSRKGKSLRFTAGRAGEDDSRVARSRALQEAVCQGVIQAQRLFRQQQKQQQPHLQQSSVVHWERFLPQQQLQVLLVEDDDSTRHVVSALLRNCSYEVTPAANGERAWELLMDQSNHVDLVLAEVVMPRLSGIGLLGRIMSHDSVKHIPVIMMSTHDSMNVVFKCLSKGAVDFLVKPVRKNELKNLWQHVWRRCNSSSGSRCASASQTRKTTRAKGGAGEVNESGSSGESDKTSNEVNIRGGSDNGSGTQSRWTKGALEVESCHQSHKLNSTGLKVGSGLNADTSTEDMPAGREHHEGKDRAMAPDLTMPKIPKIEITYVNNATSTCEAWGSVPASADDVHKTGSRDAGSGSLQGNPHRAKDLMGAPYIKEQDSNEEQQGDNEDDDDLLEKHASNSLSSKDKNLSDSSSPLLDSSNLVKLGMKCSREAQDQEVVKGSKGGLVHSYTSAFSRYNTSSNFAPANARTYASNTHTVHGACENGLPAQENHAVPASLNSQLENAAIFSGCSDEKSSRPFPDNNSKLENLPETSAIVVDGTTGKEEVPSAVPPLPSSFPLSDQPGLSSVPLTVHYGASAQVGESDSKDCYANYDQNVFVYSRTNQYHHHSHHHHHHHHIQHHYHHVSDDKHYRPKTLQTNDQTVTDVGGGAPGSGSSNVANGNDGINIPSGSSNGHGSNGNGAVSVNGSATGSNYGSNGQSPALVMPGGGNLDVKTQGEPDNGVPDPNGILSGHDESRVARREAALTKFRQKRKERCFEKKVRYESRKRLAEQRPRVRGQFVKQTLAAREYEPT